MKRFGFTLIELLLVVIVVGILAVAALPSFSRGAERAKVKDAQAVLAAIYSAERVYNLDGGRYGTLDDLISRRYISNPNPPAPIVIQIVPGPQPPASDWFYSTSNESATTFTATAKRTGGGWKGNTISVTEKFDGSNYVCNGYNDPSLCP